MLVMILGAMDYDFLKNLGSAAFGSAVMLFWIKSLLQDRDAVRKDLADVAEKYDERLAAIQKDKDETLRLSLSALAENNLFLREIAPLMNSIENVSEKVEEQHKVTRDHLRDHFEKTLSHVEKTIEMIRRQIGDDGV